MTRKRSEKAPRRAAGYIRVSSEEQAQGGHSLAAQRRQVRSYCEARGWGLVEVFVDAGYSGKDLRRPALQALLSRCDAGEVDVMVVTDLDRLSRSRRDIENLLHSYFDEDGVAFCAVNQSFDTTTATGDAFLGMLAVFAQLERRMLSERTKNGIAQAKREGRVPGRAPFGWRREGSVLVKDPEQQKALRRARRLRRQGKSLREVAAAMGWHLSATVRRLGSNGRRRMGVR